MLFSIRSIPDFLNQEEVIEVREKVHELKPYWRHIKDFPIAKSVMLLSKQNPELYKSAENQHFLGDSLYVIEKLEQINWDIQEEINFNFSPLYDRLQKVIEEVSGMPAEYIPSMAVPGFHVFHGQQRPHPFEWHIDTTICRFDGVYKPENVYSFLCLIESPQDAAGLEYKDSTDWDSHEDLETKIFTYDLGTLFLWKGDRIHRMKRFAMNEGESRITLQGHFVVHKGKALIHW
jgi:hypothetical protein